MKLPLMHMQWNLNNSDITIEATNDAIAKNLKTYFGAL